MIKCCKIGDREGLLYSPVLGVAMSSTPSYTYEQRIGWKHAAERVRVKLKHETEILFVRQEEEGQ